MLLVENVTIKCEVMAFDLETRQWSDRILSNVAVEPELFEGFDELLLSVCRANAEDDTRWTQTSVGWLLRELSHREPEIVQQFLIGHPELSAEARRAASAGLDIRR